MEMSCGIAIDVISDVTVIVVGPFTELNKRAFSPAKVELVIVKPFCPVIFFKLGR